MGLLGGSLACLAQTNNWTSPTSGHWEDASWSLGILPAANQSVMITNAGSKAVGIFPTTPVNFPGSMTVSNLMVSAPGGSQNTLLLNYAGTAVPLNILSDFTVGTNGSIVDFYSGLQVGADFTTTGAFIQEGGVTTVTNGYFRVDAGKSAVTNATLQLGSFVVYDTGDFAQSGGTVTNDFLGVEGGFNPGADANYSLTDGVLISGGASIYYEAGFLQVGGRHTVIGDLEMIGFENQDDILTSSYTLQGGFLSCGSLLESVLCSFVQIGGTNQIGGDLDVYVSRYSLNDGWLSDSTAFVGPNPGKLAPDDPLYAIIHQVGGVHWSTNGLTCEATYQLDSGILIARNIFLDGGELVIGPSPAATITNTGWFEMQGGTIQLSNSTQQLAPLALFSNYLAFSSRAVINFSSGACKLSFADSSGSLAWDSGATLIISNWNGSLSGGGMDQLFFGNSASGLPAAQVQQVQFINPSGLPPGTWFAKLLPTGELVPTAQPLMTASTERHEIIGPMAGAQRFRAASRHESRRSFRGYSQRSRSLHQRHGTIPAAILSVKATVNEWVRDVPRGSYGPSR